MDQPTWPEQRSLGREAKRLNQGDPSADTSGFQDQLISALPRMRAYARALAGNSVDADDLVQELVVRALTAQTSFIAGTNFGAWCYAILRNQFISTQRGAARQTSTPEDAFFLPSEGTQEIALYTQEVLNAVSRLPPRLRGALTLYLEGMSYSDVAAGTGVGIGTVRSRASRARTAIRRTLHEMETLAILTAESPGCTWNLKSTRREKGKTAPDS